MVSLIPPLHLVIQDYQIEMQGDFFSHLTLYSLASCDVNGIINSYFVFVRSRQLKKCANNFLLCNTLMSLNTIQFHIMLTVLSIATFHLIGHDDKK